MKNLCAAALLIAGILASTMPAGAASSPSPSPSPSAIVTPAASPAGAGTVAQAAGVSPNGTQREVFGFALASSLNDPTVGYPSWNFSLLSTVAFFGLDIGDDGAIASDSNLTVWNSSQLSGLVTTAHASGTKVVVTIIEQDFASGTPDMCAALIHRGTTVSQTVAQVIAKGVDGVNIDFEGLADTCSNGLKSRAMLTDLAHRLRTALPAGSYLSIDTYASAASDPAGFFDIAGLNAYVNSFFVMAYDLEYSNYSRPPTSCSTFCLGPTAPRTGYYYNDVTTTGQYKLVVGASKIILGVPYYGRKSCVSSVKANAVPTSAVVADTYLDASGESGAAAVQPGSYVSHRDAHDPAGQERWDTWYNTTLACTRELYWDDTVSLGVKYDLVNNNALRGVGIWNLNYGGGASELWADLHDHFAACTGAALAASPASPQQRGVLVHLTASSSGCASPRYEFWLQYPSGTWVMKQAFSATATWSWDTSAYPAGNYTLHVWANQAGGDTATYQSVGELKFTVGAPVHCTTTSLTPASPSAVAGSMVTLTASSTACAAPRYEFWVQYLNKTWYLKQGWGGPAFNWSTAGLAPGTYTVHAWANENGDPTTTYEGLGSDTVTLTGCTAATLTPATGSSKVGTPITFTATSSGCPNPVYEFWLQWVNGTWHQMTGFGGASWTWKTTPGYSKGTYHVHVWANQQGAYTGALEVFGASTRTLT